MDENIEFYEDEAARSPGYLIRRLHQIYLALFAQECTGFGLSEVQHTVLARLAAQPGLDQWRLCSALELDRGTLVIAVTRLVEAGLIQRMVNKLDRREKLLTLTPPGRALLAEMSEPAARAHARSIAALPPQQRAMFLDLLGKLTAAGHDLGAVKTRGK